MNFLSSPQSILITGHSRGLGEALFRIFTEQGHHVIGCSRQNGFDLNKLDQRQAAITQSNDCSLVVNNARAGFGQVEFLSELYENWFQQKKSGYILNIGSIGGSDYCSRENSHELYFYQKEALQNLSATLARRSPRIRVSCLLPGYFNTERILKKNLTEPALDVTAVVKTIEWMINQPKEIHVSALTLTAWPPPNLQD